MEFGSIHNRKYQYQNDPLQGIIRVDSIFHIQPKPINIFLWNTEPCHTPKVYIGVFLSLDASSSTWLIINIVCCGLIWGLNISCCRTIFHLRKQWSNFLNWLTLMLLCNFVDILRTRDILYFFNLSVLKIFLVLWDCKTKLY